MVDGIADMVRDWHQVRNILDRLVDGGQRTPQRVANSVEDLADAAKLRMEKARLERTRFEKRAELGTRVYELAKAPSRPEGRHRKLWTTTR